MGTEVEGYEIGLFKVTEEYVGTLNKGLLR